MPVAAAPGGVVDPVPALRAMNEQLRDRVTRTLETLSDERGYQVLDYVEFLAGRYAEREAEPATVFQRFAEVVEDNLRAGRVSAQTIGETMTFLSKAMGVLDGVAAAGKSVAGGLMDVAAGAGARPAAPAEEGTVPPPRPTGDVR
ncbi:MAG: hypothetical protein NVS4B3_24690 [Gemmatimonadaceae bacterium]